MKQQERTIYNNDNESNNKDNMHNLIDQAYFLFWRTYSETKWSQSHAPKNFETTMGCGTLMWRVQNLEVPSITFLVHSYEQTKPGLTLSFSLNVHVHASSNMHCAPQNINR